ncbi:hypothetical protein ACKFKF_23390 [Phormidesmis sp. 146-12]
MNTTVSAKSATGSRPSTQQLSHQLPSIPSPTLDRLTQTDLLETLPMLKLLASSNRNGSNQATRSRGG